MIYRPQLTGHYACYARPISHAKNNALQSDNDAGYESLSKILPEFKKLGLLPVHMSVLSADNVSDFVSVLKENSAKWHKSCRNKFNTRELERKTANASKFEPTECELTYPDEADNKRRCTRSDFTSENPLRVSKPVFFSVTSRLLMITCIMLEQWN